MNHIYIDHREDPEEILVQVNRALAHQSDLEFVLTNAGESDTYIYKLTKKESKPPIQNYLRQMWENPDYSKVQSCPVCHKEQTTYPALVACNDCSCDMLEHISTGPDIPEFLEVWDYPYYDGYVARLESNATTYIIRLPLWLLVTNYNLQQALNNWLDAEKGRC